MKKLTLLLALGVCIGFTSCKKSFSCDCTYSVEVTASGFSAKEEGTLGKAIKDTKKKAEKACKDYENEIKANNTSFYSDPNYTVTSNANCTLK